MDEEEFFRRLDAMTTPLFGSRPKPSPPLTERTLDEIFATRTHVRVLRGLVELDRKLNLSVRGLARRIDVSHGRVLEVLQHLLVLGLVNAHRAPSYALYQLNDKHPLQEAIRSLFEEERRTAEDELASLA